MSDLTSISFFGYIIIFITVIFAGILIIYANLNRGVKTLKEKPKEIPIIKGQTWVLNSNDGSPWPRTSQAKVEILDVKDGWVRFSGVGGCDWRDMEETFRRCYTLVSEDDNKSL
jgi:hypothetical protein